jgi:hypothetical protein
MGLYLEKGELKCWGPIDQAVSHYIGGGIANAFDGTIPANLPRQYFTGEARLRKVQLVGPHMKPVRAVVTGQPLEVLIEWEVVQPIDAAMIEIGITDSEGRQITQSFSSDAGAPPMLMQQGIHQIHLRIDHTIFPGRYSLLAGIHKMDGATVDFVERALDFEVLNAGRGEPNHYPWTVRGYLRPSQQWGARVARSAPGNGTQ